MSCWAFLCLIDGVIIVGLVVGLVAACLLPAVFLALAVSVRWLLVVVFFAVAVVVDVVNAVVVCVGVVVFVGVGCCC